MYDPRVGVWLNLDPIGFEAGDANPNRYVGNSPTNATDPSGLEPPSSPMGPGSHLYDLGYGAAAEARARRTGQRQQYQAVYIGQIDKAESANRNYEYYDIMNLKGVFDRLRQAIRSVPNFEQGTEVVDPVYSPFLNTMEVPLTGLNSISQMDAVHEAVHALDDQQNWNFSFGGPFQDNFRSKRDSTLSRAEGLAYMTVRLLFTGVGGLRDLEDDVNTGRIGTATEATQRWDFAVWQLTQFHPGDDPMSDVFVDTHYSRFSDERDLEEVRRRLGIRLNIAALRDSYQDLLRKHGISATLAIPENLWPAFIED